MVAAPGVQLVIVESCAMLKLCGAPVLEPVKLPLVP
jgi:hypothetical protein